MITLVQGLRDMLTKVDISADMLQGQWGRLGANVAGADTPLVTPVSAAGHAQAPRAQLVMVVKEAIAKNAGEIFYETIEANDGSADDDGKFPYAFLGNGFMVEDDQLTDVNRTLADWTAAVPGVTRLSLNALGFPTYAAQADAVVGATEIGTFWNLRGNTVTYLIG